MKLSGKLPMGCPSPLTPFPTLSGTSMSSKTPGRDLKDMGSLDRVQDVWSSWNFQGSFIGVALAPWHHFQLCQEPPCPPRIQEETWRTWRDLKEVESLDRKSILMKLSGMLPRGCHSPWHHFQLSQEPPCPPRLQGKTWRIWSLDRVQDEWS